MEADITSQAVGLATNTDFSITQLFVRADIIVKSVIIILIASSIFSWAIIYEKIKLFKKINKSSEEFEEKFWKSKSAETFYNSLPSDLEDPMALVFKGSMQAMLKSKSKSSDSLWLKIGGDGYKTRVVNGLLEIKAKSAMLGYLNASNPFTKDGYFKTGDSVEVKGEYIKKLRGVDWLRYGLPFPLIFGIIGMIFQ